MFSKKLILKKTHDFCAVKEPRLTVIFIHGIAADSSCFNNAIKYLEGTTSLKEVRFVAFDLLGSGQSYANDKLNYDYKEQLEALHNSIEKLKLTTPLVLVGHSRQTFDFTFTAGIYGRRFGEPGVRKGNEAISRGCGNQCKKPENFGRKSF